jgi:hypothetical protein
MGYGRFKQKILLRPLVDPTKPDTGLILLAFFHRIPTKNSTEEKQYHNFLPDARRNCMASLEWLCQLAVPI